MPQFTAAPSLIAHDVIARAEASRDRGETLAIDEDETDIVITQWNFVCRQGTERSAHSRYHLAENKAARLAGCRESGHLYITSYIGPICARCCRPRDGR